MDWIKAIGIAVGTYSVLPMPQYAWEGKSLRLAIFFLPLIGFIQGGALLCWQWITITLRIPAVLFGAVASVLPLLIAGGIHMDGYMDVCDALASHQPRERKLEIMKDPHCGAFAVIRCAAYLLLSFGLYAAAFRTPVITAMSIGFILSRILVVISALTLPNARGGGMLFIFTENVSRRTPLAVLCVLCVCGIAAMVLFAGLAGVGGSLLAVSAFWYYRIMTRKQFGGATGDTSGYFLQLCELLLLVGAYAGGLLT